MCNKLPDDGNRHISISLIIGSQHALVSGLILVPMTNPYIIFSSRGEKRDVSYFYCGLLVILLWLIILLLFSVAFIVAYCGLFLLWLIRKVGGRMES